MSQRRKLTLDEKKKVEAHARRKDEQRFPGRKLSITVDDEIDDDGKVHWNTVAFDEAPMKDIPDA